MVGCINVATIDYTYWKLIRFCLNEQIVQQFGGFTVAMTWHFVFFFATSLFVV
jgi:hypothetical protein